MMDVALDLLAPLAPLAPSDQSLSQFDSLFAFLGPLEPLGPLGPLGPLDPVPRRKRARACAELLDDSSALHEWPVRPKRLRKIDAPESAGVVFEGGTPSSLGLPCRAPARPRAFAMHAFEDGEPAESGRLPIKNSCDSNAMFVRFAQMANNAGITPLRMLPPDVFPADADVRHLVCAIVAR